MLEVVVKYLYLAFTKVKILAFTVYLRLSHTWNEILLIGLSSNHQCLILMSLSSLPGIQ